MPCPFVEDFIDEEAALLCRDWHIASGDDFKYPLTDFQFVDKSDQSEVPPWACHTWASPV